MSEIKRDENGNIITEETPTEKYDYKKDESLIIKTPPIQPIKQEEFIEQNKRKFPWKYIILAIVVIAILILVLIFLFSNSSYYLNALSFPIEAKLNSFVSILVNQTHNQKITSFSFGSFANATLIHPINLASMSMNSFANIQSSESRINSNEFGFGDVITIKCIGVCQ